MTIFANWQLRVTVDSILAMFLKMRRLGGNYFFIYYLYPFLFNFFLKMRGELKTGLFYWFTIFILFFSFFLKMRGEVEKRFILLIYHFYPFLFVFFWEGELKKGYFIDLPFLSFSFRFFWEGELKKGYFIDLPFLSFSFRFFENERGSWKKVYFIDLQSLSKKGQRLACGTSWRRK